MYMYIFIYSTASSLLVMILYSRTTFLCLKNALNFIIEKCVRPKSTYVALYKILGLILNMAKLIKRAFWYLVDANVLCLR